MLTRLVLLLALLLGVNASSGSLAQGSDCPVIVQTALESTDQACLDTGRNQVCYGHLNLDAEPVSDVTNLVFANRGDKVAVNQVQRLQLYPMDEATQSWGVVLMRLQANLPDTMPGQNVTFLLFGDVELENATRSTINVTTKGGVNLHDGPSTDHDIVGSLVGGQTVAASGRLADNTWLQVALPDSGRSGWVFADLVTTEVDMTMLAVVGPAETGSIQAFYFRTGIGDAPCEEAPNSGILVRTPQGVGEVALTMNGVDLGLGSTAFLQASPGEDMRVNVLEGQARVTAFGVQQEARMNMRIRVPLDDQLVAAGPPLPPERCAVSDIQGLPEGSGDCREVWVNLDNQCPVTVPYGMTIHISNGFGYHTRSEAEAGRGPQVAAIVIDGVTVADTVGSVTRHPNNLWGFGMQYTWRNPPPGEHLVLGPGPHGSHIGLGSTRTCHITVLEPPE